MKLPRNIQLALEMLERKGYEAVVVGGALRDYLLGKTPHDYDISTNALPEEVKEVFQNYYIIDTGIKHGTVTVFFNHQQIEITTFRIDTDYEDFRHPKKVVFVRDLKTDLNRRDFTINAICYNKEIIDYVGGIEDLNKKIIRAIGDGSMRFTEDPLRILRALRFASTLSFTIEENTKKAMFEHVQLLHKVSKERINLEISKLMLGKNAFFIINEYFEIFKVLIPELSLINIKKYQDVFYSLKNEISTKLASLFLDLGIDVTTDILKRYKYSNKIINDVRFLIGNFNLEITNDEYIIRKLLGSIDYDGLISLIDFKNAYNQNVDYQSIKITLNTIYEQDRCFRVKDLKISGRDLLKIGYEEGMKIRLVLEEILDEVIRNKLPNQKDELIRRALELK